MGKWKWFICVIVFLLLAGIALAVFGVILPLQSARSSMDPSGILRLEHQDDGTWLLSWPEAENADVYRVEILKSGEGDGLLFREFVSGQTNLVLPGLPVNDGFTLQICPGAKFRTIFGENIRFSQEPLNVSTFLGDLELQIQDFSVDGDSKTVRMDVLCPQDCRWQYRLTDQAGNLLEEKLPEGNVLELQFAEESALAVPEDGADYQLTVRAIREENNLVIFGTSSNPFRITNNSLQFRKLNPKLTETAKNTICLTWEETRAARCEVQLLNTQTGAWDTLREISADVQQEFTDCLEPGETRQYRIVSFDDQNTQLEVSETLSVQGRSRVQYATVWPVRDLAAYSGTNYGEIVAVATVGTAYCVLEEKNGMFAVQIDDQICYIEANNCMINLPEYLGGLCSYNITNSVYAIYAVHEFAIPDVTGVVTVGYENVCQDDGTFLVPLLYPVAKRLLNAAYTARDLGYRLKIYDSFRPYVATREIYDITSLIMNNPLPDQTYTGTPKSQLELPAPRPGAAQLTYGWLMTGTNYELNSFLAKGGSAHNVGIALDLTLEKLDTGVQLDMQSAMHDLSHFSVVPENNESADLLGDIMQGAGFSGLISEWWHFQDNRSRREYAPASVTYGVSAECWMKDDFGWKYRTPKGSYYINQTAEISGKTYTFDANGYVMN